MPVHSKATSNPVFPDEPDLVDPTRSRISRLERMGILCTVLKLIATLKAPYQCIVRCGYNTMKGSWLMIALGIILMYFFCDNMFEETGVKRYFALLGVILLVMGIAFFSMGMAICIFYIRLYKAHERQLHELAVQNYLTSPGATPPPIVQSPRTPRSTAPSKPPGDTVNQIWTIQPNPYMYNTPQPSAPPPPLDAFSHPQVYGVRAWDFTANSTGDASSGQKLGIPYRNK